MRVHEIVVGVYYRATVHGNMVTVRVDEKWFDHIGSRVVERYKVTNLSTKQQTIFKSSRRFHCAAKNACGNPAEKTHGYTCPYCGEHHVSDDTELWCLIAKQNHMTIESLGKPEVLRDTAHPEGL